ncbi:hypothetical protein [Streptomyces goshikiensis]|uniref:hypothetical protein n=1 Tax=Streptomyces goshikiensis TaxID=1942 RepID=UPI00380E4E87
MARPGLVDLMMAGGPELASEAELRLWKNHAMKQDDIAKTLARMETLHTATYEGWQQGPQGAGRRKGRRRLTGPATEEGPRTANAVRGPSSVAGQRLTD